MKKTAPYRIALALGVLMLLRTPALRAGQEVQEPSKDADPKLTLDPGVRTWFPDTPPGFVTFGTQFSQHDSGAYVDSITGLWAPRSRDEFLFLDSRYHWEDDGEFISSTGLGFRKLYREQEVILGVNAYWDSIDSRNGNDFNQLGLGAEVLTHWVDFRFNAYVPDGSRYEVGRQTASSSHDSLGGPYVQGGAIDRNLTQTTETETFKRYETGLQGCNTELGFLLPGVDKYMEVRTYAGYYHYDNPFGKDFNGFKARLEARVLPGVFADVEYWDSAALMGGHWTAGFRVSVPFSIYNLVTGRNPFDGLDKMFTPRQRDFSERMGDMVIRSPRIQTVTSGLIPSGTSISTHVTTIPVGVVPPPPFKVAPTSFPLE